MLGESDKKKKSFEGMGESGDREAKVERKGNGLRRTNGMKVMVRRLDAPCTCPDKSFPVVNVGPSVVEGSVHMKRDWWKLEKKDK